MKKYTSYSLLGLAVLLVLTLLCAACGTLEIGVETPVDGQADEPEQQPFEDEAEAPTGGGVAVVSVAAWFGHVASAPDGSEYDDQFELLPEGTGIVGLESASAEIEAELAALRDADGPEEHVHIWGELVCGVEDAGGCRVTVDRLRYGSIMLEPEEISGWEGVITTGSFNGGLSYIFVRNEGGYLIQYSIHSIDDQILSRLESLAETDALVRVSGVLMTGIPDVNGSRIQAESLEVVGEGEAVAGATPVPVDVYAGWETYTNERYGYSFRYPATAELSESGVTGFDPASMPDGMTPDTYMEQLSETFGENLCVYLDFGLGYLAITPAENADFRYATCGRTGVGAGELVDQTLDVTIAGQVVQAAGYEVVGDGETLDLHNESMVVVLENGLRIEFGSMPRTDATYSDYLMKGRDLLFLILASIEVIG